MAAVPTTYKDRSIIPLRNNLLTEPVFQQAKIVNVQERNRRLRRRKILLRKSRKAWLCETTPARDSIEWQTCTFDATHQLIKSPVELERSAAELPPLLSRLLAPRAIKLLVPPAAPERRSPTPAWLLMFSRWHENHVWKIRLTYSNCRLW